MTAPSPDLIRAARAGCNAVSGGQCVQPRCIFEICNASVAIRAALAELAEPSMEMTAAAADRPASQFLAASLWRAMMRKVLGDEP